MSRTGLFRAAALLAASAAPLLAGSASAAELPQVGAGVPEVGADKLITDATQHANPLESANAVQLPHVKAPVGGDLPIPALPGAAQERTLPNPVAAELGTLPSLPNAQELAGTSHVGDLKAPALSDLPTNNVVPNPHVLSGTLPTING
ncbi:hypothetical protein [Lentzea sp. NBRC 102530]|uniref:hypothetical protein n=1 Tax=Lentzea sp. NBRC 102530 TaxID=3032201 RepID=UPI0024A03A09|nr:hypothetical protein [Lentzea sp. NBRC 102530]GLY50936.1 hypothetical protein Lesp01_45920 [Lentzea sp. NBRC 102530]